MRDHDAPCKPLVDTMVEVATKASKDDLAAAVAAVEATNVELAKVSGQVAAALGVLTQLASDAKKSAKTSTVVEVATKLIPWLVAVGFGVANLLK